MAAAQIVQIIDRLLRFRSATEVATQDFRSQKHNKHLCPAVEKQMKRIVNSFEKYQKVVYDIQGIHDRGTDIVVRMPFVSDAAPKASHNFICIQIKSFNDLEDSKYLQVIKAQWAETLTDRKDNLEHYYLLLCTDAVQHKEKVREINGFFVNSPNTTVISPGESWTFLRLGDAWISAVVESVLLEGDTVRRKARDYVLDLTPQETAILVFALCKEIESVNRVAVEELKKSSFLSQLYQRVPDYPRDYFVGSDEFEDDELEDEDLDHALNDNEGDEDDYVGEPLADQGRPTDARLAQDLDELPLSISNEDKIEFHAEAIRPIQALILDAIVRYGLTGESLVQHVVAVVRVDKSLEFEALEE